MNTLKSQVASTLTETPLLARLKERLHSEAPLLIAGLGDSLTYGWMVDRGFFDRFVDKLEEAYPERDIRRINAGIPGDTADGGLLRLDKLLSQKPDLVIVEFGLNDMCCDITADEFQSTLETIARRVLKTDAFPLLVTSCPLPWAEGARMADAFYDRIRAAAKSTAVPSASLDLYWQRIKGPPTQWDDLLQSDKVHPTDRGHALMAQGLTELLLPKGSRS